MVQSYVNRLAKQNLLLYFSCAKIFFIFALNMKNYDELTAEAVELLSRLIATPSVSREEGEAATLLEQWMLSHDIAPQRVANNLVVRGKENKAGQPTLLLNAHIDTVRSTQLGRATPLSPLLRATA